MHYCVDSILAQTFTDFELILVDDGSPDNCGRICDEYAERDARVKVIHQSNKGVSVARNQGVLSSSGEYITFIDSDDWVDSRYLARLYHYAALENADVCVASICVVEAPDDEKPFSVEEHKVFNKRQAIEYLGRLNDTASFRGPVVKLIRKKIALKYPFPEGRSYAEDMAVVYKWYNSCRIVVSLQDRLYFYRQNENSSSHRPAGFILDDNRKTLEEMLSFFRKNGYKELYKTFAIEYEDNLLGLERLMEESEDIAGKKKASRRLKKKLRKAFLINKSKHPFNDKNIWLYEKHFPFEMQLYWYGRAIIRRLKRENN